MTDTSRHREATFASDGPGANAAVEGAVIPAKVMRREYGAPRLTAIISTDALLDVLGPAQANYGGP